MDYHITTVGLIAIIVLGVWEIIWKGIGLWRAARLQQMGWFVAMLVLNTAGLLPIIYVVTHKEVHYGQAK